MSEESKAASRPSRPSLFLGAAHLAALWALAILQPMLALLGDNPEFFVARGNTAGQIVLFALSLAFIPPLASLGVEAIARRISESLRWSIHLVLMGLVGSVLALQILKRFAEGPAGLLIAVGLLLGFAGALAYGRWAFPRAFMDILTPAPVIVLAIFFFFSGTSKLILPQTEPAAADVRVGEPSRVIMVVFDEFPTASLMDRQGKVDATRFPAFAELADSSTWYLNTTARGAYTPIAVPAMLTGRTVGHNDLPIASDHPESLFTLLGGTYEMNVSESATRICPEDLCPENVIGRGESSSLEALFRDLEVVQRHLLLPESMRQGLPDISKTFGEFTNETENLDQGVRPAAQSDYVPERRGQGAARRLGRAIAGASRDDEIERVERFAETIVPTDGPVLDFIHIEKPHYPWRHLPNGQRYTNLKGEWSGLLPNDRKWKAEPKVVDIALQRHLLEVGFTDGLLSRIIDRLKASDLWEDSMVVVTADHGVAFQSEVDRRRAVSENLGEVASVPLFIKQPGQDSAEVNRSHFCLTDLLPEVARRLGVEYPWQTEPCDEVLVRNSPSGDATGPVSEAVAQRWRQVERIEEVFGTGVGWGPTYRFGPRNDLIGRRVSSLNATWAIGRYRLLPERRNLPADFDPDAPAVLALLQRGLTKRFGENRILAVAVDGRIQGTGWTFKPRTGTGPGYSILLPPGALKAGFNRVDIYLLEDAGRHLQLVYSNAKNPPPLLPAGLTGAKGATGPTGSAGPTGSGDPGERPDQAGGSAGNGS